MKVHDLKDIVSPDSTRRVRAMTDELHRHKAASFFKALFTAALLIVLIASLLQRDAATSKYAAAGLLLILLMIVTAFTRRMSYIGFWIPFSFAAAVAWLYWGGSYNHRLDPLLMFACFAGTAFLHRRKIHIHWRPFKFKHEMCGHTGFRFSCLFLLSFWLSASSFDLLLTRCEPLARDPGRFVRLREQSPYGDLNVGLALSGGGYRAAMMHAGVLDALEKMKVPVTHITSVSGGSVIGAFYAAGGLPEGFRDAVTGGKFNLTREMTNAYNVVRLASPMQIPWTKTRLLPTQEFERTDIQSELLDKILLGGTTFGQLEQNEAAPVLMVCATDLYSGASVGISKRGVLRRSIVRPGEKDSYINVRHPKDGDECTYFGHDAKVADSTPLSHAVAASGAFPGAFNAVREEITFKEGAEPRHVLLADGGLSDNSALTVMAFADEKAGWKLDFYISSDAGALFNEREDIQGFGELTRSVDVIYANLGAWRAPAGTCPLNKTRLLLTPDKYLNHNGGQTDKVSEDSMASAVAESVNGMDAEALGLACNLLADAGRDGEARAIRAAVLGGDDAAREARKQLATLLKGELSRSLDAFTGAPTLEDHFDADLGGRLYRLGQLLVVLDWGEFKKVLQEKLDKRASEARDALARHDARAETQTATLRSPAGFPASRKREVR